MSVIRQIYSTMIICCTCLNLGIIFAWPSSTIKQFASTNTTLNRPMSEMEISLFGSLSSFAALFSTPISGILLDLLGRKYCCILFSLPTVIAWTIVSLIPRVEAILFSVFLSGIGGCVFVIVPNFISELCQENIRGILTSGSIIFYGIGLTLSYVLGGCLEYHMMNYVCLTISVTSLAMLSLVKESPVHLMKKGFDESAVQAISFYRSALPNSKKVQQEIEVLRKLLSPQLHDVKFEEETLKPEHEPQNYTKLQFIKKSKSSLRGLGIIIALFFFSVFQGIVVVQVYSEPIFNEALPNVSANLNSILLSLVNVVFGFISACSFDYFGRRPLMIYFPIGTFLTCFALGTQIQFHWGPSWLTIVLVYMYCITTTCGGANAPYVVMSELFLPEVRGIMTMLAIEWGWLCMFLVLFMFNPFIKAVGLGPVFYVFAFISLITSIFSLFYLPETKGLSIQVIQTLLLKGRQY